MHPNTHWPTCVVIILLYSMYGYCTLVYVYLLLHMNIITLWLSCKRHDLPPHTCFIDRPHGIFCVQSNAVSYNHKLPIVYNCFALPSLFFPCVWIHHYCAILWIILLVRLSPVESCSTDWRTLPMRSRNIAISELKFSTGYNLTKFWQYSLLAHQYHDLLQVHYCTTLH